VSSVLHPPVESAANSGHPLLRFNSTIERPPKTA